MYVRFGKRICDIIIGLVALPFVLLIIAVLAPIIKHEDGGPVFYNAPRVGKDGVDFKMYKLRSMRVNAPDLVMEDGSTYNGADDPRMTKIGAFMRKTSLDELPQIYNILAGQMSIIGPRPALYNQYDLIDARDKVHANDIRPGLTGLAQINGRDELPIDVKAKYDGEYAAHLTFGMDLKIFFHSFSYVFQRRGVVEGGTGSIQEPNKQKPSN